MIIIRNRALFFFIGFSILFSQDTTSINTKKIGPLYNELPLLDSIIFNVSEDSILKFSKKEKFETKSISTLSTSGTFFRSIDMSSYGEGSFNGGIRFQMLGQLTEDIQISGIISDESFPIQPEGNTATLDEIDKIYINAVYPSGELTAGDIAFSNNSGVFNTFIRNLSGVRTKFNTNGKDFKSVYGKSKGIYNRIELKGMDGNQGPYYLITKEGKKNIVISAGSEVVWLNGEKMTRGEDNDYIIDYSSGEIIFTSKNLIFYDTDIDLEYQYQLSRYSQNFIGASVADNSNSFFNYNLSFSKEGDDKSLIGDEDKKIFKSIDFLFETGAIADSTGDYDLVGNDYIYNPSEVPSGNKFRVAFDYDPNGRYVRRITDSNRVYYGLLEITDDKNIEKFSPGRSIRAPNASSVIHLSTSTNLDSGIDLETEIALSNNNSNTLNNKDNFIKKGNALSLKLIKERINLGGINSSFLFSHWQNTKNFKVLSRSKDVNFNEDWDLIDTTKFGSEQQTSFAAAFNLGSRLNSSMNYSTYSLADILKKRKTLNLDYKGNMINEIRINYSLVESDKFYNKIDGDIYFFDKKIKPYIAYKAESKESAYKYNDIRFGLKRASNSPFFISYGIRSDDLTSVDENTLSTNSIFQSQKSKFFQLDYIRDRSNGLRQNYSFRKKISDQENAVNSNTSSLRAVIDYRKKQKPLQFDLVLNSSNSFYQTRSVVFDSVGSGFGNYRYDNVLNEYISDENGDFISYTIFSGVKKNGYRIDGFSKIYYDFSSINIQIFKPLKYRNLFRVDLHSSGDLMDVGIDKILTQFYKYRHRSELIYQKKKSLSRYKVYFQEDRNFNSMDSRGWSDRTKSEYAFESSASIGEGYFLLFDIESYSNITQYGNESLFDRTIEGISTDIGIKKKLNSRNNINARMNLSKEEVFLSNDLKKVNSTGIEINHLMLLDRNGRLDTKIVFYDVKGFDSMPYELAKGRPSGLNLRFDTSLMFQVSNAFNLRMNALFRDDQRYANLFKFSGEISANF